MELSFFWIMTLSCVFFNARGLMDMKKIEKIKEICNREDIIALQETNWRDEIMNDLKKKWDGGIFFNNGDGKMGRGVAFLMKNEVFKSSKVIYVDKIGKCIIVEIKYDEEEMILVNVHAPNKDGGKKQFFNELRGVLKTHKKIIMMGDFNTIFSKQDMGWFSEQIWEEKN